MSLTDLAGVLAQSRPVDAASVLTTLQSIEQAVPQGDGIGWFTKLYIKVAERVGAAVDERSFEDPAFIERLDVVFAGLYFSALMSFLRSSAVREDAADTPRAWYPVLAAHADTGLTPIQFALAGMNAHINRDLMVALVQVWQERGMEPSDDSACKRDYDRVNGLLAQVELQVRGWFLHGVVRDVEQLVSRVDRQIESFSLVEARQSAWQHARALWHLRGSELLSRGYIDALDGLVGFAGRGLLVRLA